MRKDSRSVRFSIATFDYWRVQQVCPYYHLLETWLRQGDHVKLTDCSARPKYRNYIIIYIIFNTSYYLVI